MVLQLFLVRVGIDLGIGIGVLVVTYGHRTSSNIGLDACILSHLDVHGDLGFFTAQRQIAVTTSSLDCCCLYLHVVRRHR